MTRAGTGAVHRGRRLAPAPLPAGASSTPNLLTDLPRRNPARVWPRENGDTAALRPKGPARLDDALDAVLKDLGIRPSPTYERVQAAFREQAGPRLAALAEATRFRRGELLVEVRSAAHAQELASFTGEALRSRINAALGSNVVERIVFKHQTGR